MKRRYGIMRVTRPAEALGWIVSRILLGIRLVTFGIGIVVCSPLILFMFGVSLVADRVEARWPDSERVRRLKFWFKLLAPVLLLIVLSIWTGMEFARARRSLSAARQTQGSPDWTRPAPR